MPSEVDLIDLPNGGIWVPSNENGDWLLVALHGSGGASGDFYGLEDIFDIPRLNYLYLNGPIKAYSGYLWYDKLGSRQDAYDSIQRTLDYCKSLGFSHKKIFLMGFSQGAALAIEFGARYPHLLAGYIGISGRIENLPGIFTQGNSDIIKQGNWLITHGTKDYNLSIDIIREQVEKLKEGGFSIDFREYDKIHEFDSKQELPDIKNWIASKML